MSALWFFAPFWAFLSLALYWYFFPSYQSLQLLPPFFVMLALAFLLPTNAWYAVFIGVLFLLLFGVKDLVFIERAFLCEILAILLLSFIFLIFFSSVSRWDGLLVFLQAFFVGTLFFFLARTAAMYRRASWEGGGPLGTYSTSKRHKLFLGFGVATLLLWQLLLVLLFTPLNTFEETALALLFSVALIELLGDYFRGRFLRHRVLFAASVLFVAMVLILSTAEWGL